MLAYIKKRRRARGSVQGLRVCNFTIKKGIVITPILTPIVTEVVGSLQKLIKAFLAYNQCAAEVLGKGRKQVGNDYETVALPLSYGG